MKNNSKISSRISVAIIIIILCFASLVGVTFALFTNGDDGVIGINVASGDIKIDIIDKNQASMLGDVLEFVGVDGDPNDIKWEPGAVRYTEPFAIKNKGDIPVSCRVYIECKERDAKLVEALEFYIISETNLKAAGGRDGLDILDASTKMQFFDKKLEPDAVSDEYYHLVIRMKPEAGNEYQGLLLKGIGITVYAVQGNMDVSDALTGTETETETKSETETQEIENQSESIQ